MITFSARCIERFSSWNNWIGGGRSSRKPSIQSGNKSENYLLSLNLIAWTYFLSLLHPPQYRNRIAKYTSKDTVKDRLFYITIMSVY